MYNVDALAEKVKCNGNTFEDYKKMELTPRLVKAVELGDDAYFIRAIVAETFISYVLEANSLTLETVFSVLPEGELRDSKMSMVKNSRLYQLYVKDIFFDDDGVSTIIGKESIPFKHLVTALAIGYHAFNVTSQTLLTKAEEIFLADPSRPAGADFKDLIDAAYFAAESGHPLINAESSKGWPSSATMH